jgi:hypothetical protein
MSVAVSSCGLTYASPSKVGGTGTGLKIFPSLLSSTAAAVVPIPTNLAGTRLEVRASGNLYVHGTSPTVGFALQLGNSLTSTNNVSIASAVNTAQSLSTANYYPYSMSVVLSGDANSNALQVISGAFCVGGNVVSVVLNSEPAAGSPASYPYSWTSSGAAFELVFGIQYGVSDALNAAQLQQFEIYA